jgi:hypothetical protein
VSITNRCCYSITDVAFKTFYGILNTQANKLLHFAEQPGSDLTPPSSFKEVVLQLVCMIATLHQPQSIHYSYFSCVITERDHGIV